MAQDFGDDAGEILLRSFQDAARRYLDRLLRSNRRGRRPARQHQEQQGESGGQAPAADAVAPAQQEEMLLPFGKSDDALDFAEVCQENGISMDALEDAVGQGYIRFGRDDLERIGSCIGQFAEAMPRRASIRSSETLQQEPIAEDAVSDLRETRADSHTQDIRNKVLDARDACSDFADFESRLAKHGIGLTNTRDGEVMFYEARTGGDGLLPFGRDASGRRDWAVGAATLKRNWGVDATYDWFERNRGYEGRSVARDEQTATDGSRDADGRTPDADQDVRSHDGMDTDASTTRIEREQNGTDVPPSEKQRASRQMGRDAAGKPTLDEEARDMREASRQLDRESGAHSREVSISDRLNPVR